MSTFSATRVAQSLAVMASLASLLPVVPLPAATAASVPPIPTPATVLSVSPTRTNLHLLVKGAVCASPNTCTRVLYRPMNDPSGVAALQAALSETPAGEQVIVFGYSEGATVVGKWLAEHADDPDIPSPELMTFVVVGNPSRHSNGITVPNGVEFPQSQYKVLDVARQYDGVADYPNNPKSPYYFLAVRNATRGALIGHLHNYSTVDIYDPANAVWTSEDGNTTYVLVPTQNVPLLGGLADLFPSWNAELKAKIETAYIRPVPFPTPADPAPSASEIVETALTAENAGVPVTVPRPAPQRLRALKLATDDTGKADVKPVISASPAPTPEAQSTGAEVVVEESGSARENADQEASTSPTSVTSHKSRSARTAPTTGPDVKRKAPLLHRLFKSTRDATSRSSSSAGTQSDTSGD